MENHKNQNQNEHRVLQETESVSVNGAEVTTAVGEERGEEERPAITINYWCSCEDEECLCVAHPLDVICAAAVSSLSLCSIEGAWQQLPHVNHTRPVSTVIIHIITPLERSFHPVTQY